MKIAMLGAALALTLGGTAAAQKRPDGPVDRDGDRRVTLAEMQSAAAARFARLDGNGDGRVTREERRAGRIAVRAERTADRVQRLGAVFVRRDADRNGVLTGAEAPRRMQGRLAELDADRDGGLSLAELQAARGAPRAEQRAQRRVERRADRPARAERGGAGVLTLAEMQAHVGARFAGLDANRDGFVTRDERRTARAGRRG